MEVRKAAYGDAQQGCQVLRRSIAELCHADHKDDPAIIAAWTANKTPEMWTTWVDQKASTLYVAVEADLILGVGMLDHAGEIMLNYVSPDARWRGVSKGLLAYMETQAFNRGLRQCSLESTETARQFYHDAGYQTNGDSRHMTKSLVSSTNAKLKQPANGL